MFKTDIKIETIDYEKLEINADGRDKLFKCADVFMTAESDELIFVCALCGEQYILEDFHIHLKMDHKKTEQCQVSDSVSTPMTESLDDTSKQEEVDNAVDCLSDDENSKEIWISEDSNMENNPSESVKIERIEPSDEEILNSKMICKHCKQSFDLVRDLQQHDCGLSNKKSFQCDICSKIFARKSNLNVHKVLHEKIKPHSCDICGSSFADKSNLIVHVRRHSKEKRHKCDYCEKSFVTSTEKIAHIRSHTGEQNFICEICGKAQSSSSKLLVHIRRHLNIKNYKCPYCNKGFCNASSLKAHRIVHEDAPRNYKCEFCDAAFKGAHSLYQHRKIHDQVKRYSCKICFKSFAQHPGLYSHMKMHRDNK